MKVSRTEARNRIAALEEELRRLRVALLEPDAAEALPEGELECLVIEAGSHRAALPLGQVEQAVSMVYVTPVQGAPSAVRGSVVFRGRVVPVVDLAVAFGDPPATLRPEDALVIVRTASRDLALAVTRVSGMRRYPRQEVAAATVPEERGFVRLLVRHEVASVVALIDPDTLLSAAELDLLDQLLSGPAHGAEEQK